MAALYKIAEKLIPSVTWSCLKASPTVYLSFDDGPHPQYTQPIMDILRRYDISATFFVIGKQASAHPHILRAIREANHTLGLHGMTHRHMIFKSGASLYQELSECKALVEAITGTTIRLFRPPYGQFGPGLLRACSKLLLQPVMWTNMPFDFHSGLSDDRVVNWAVNRSTNGTIIVLHDGHPFSHRTVRILPTIIESLLDRGYAFGEVPQEAI